MQIPRTAVVITIVLMIGLGFLSAHSVYMRDRSFERNQACAGYIFAIEKKFEESGFTAPDMSSWQSSNLLKMFYSKKTNSCLYTWQQSIGSDAGGIFFYTLTDALSGEIILRTEGLMVGETDFDQKKQAFFDDLKQFS